MTSCGEKDKDKEAPLLLSEYLQLTTHYKKIYGPNTVLIMQVGAFFEIYGLKNIQTGDIQGSSIVDVCQICQLNISEKKICVGYDQVLMAGFRDYTLDKYIQKISEGGYTLIVYVQDKNGKTITRKLHSIHSPGTYISYETDSSTQITNNIMCIWFELVKPLHSGSYNIPVLTSHKQCISISLILPLCLLISLFLCFLLLSF